MPTLKTPAEKLSLTVRKNLRDKWEPAKAGYETEMQKLLGETWTIEMNPNLIHEYAKDDDYKSRVGTVVTWYFDAFMSNLKTFVRDFGPDGVNELNNTCSKHQVVFAPQEDTEFRYGGLVVEDSVLRLVFAEDCLASNVNDISRDFATALAKAPASADGAGAFNLVARNAVQKDYTSKIESLRKSIASLVGMSDLEFEPNFEGNSAELAKSPKHKDDGWEKRIGKFTLEYFNALESYLKQKKFKEDDMQQEAFQEAVTAGLVTLEILPKWEDGKSRYSEVKINKGVLCIRTTADNWGVNVNNAADGLLDQL